MPAVSPTILAFSAVYVMDATSSDVLIQVPALRSRGAIIKENYPTDYVQIYGNRIQSDFHTANLTLTFIADSTLTTVIAKGASVLSGTANTPPPSSGGNQYSIFLLSPNAGTQTSYYFPAINSVSSTQVSYTKNAVAELEINFIATARDWNTILYYKDTKTNCISYMGSRSPV